MGGVQSGGTHSLGEALWVHERQRQKCHRDGTRNDTTQGNHHQQSATQDRRKLLKRTRSLAVISEDESRQQDRREEIRHFQLGETSLDLPWRHQLIPRAKLIDRNSLKDRLYKSQQHLSDSYDRFNEVKSGYSRSTCGLHSIHPVLSSLPNPLAYSARTTNRSDPDRLNILDWPEPPRRYRSVQTLDTVTGLVDIVDDNWPIEGNRSIDCIYTQVKRKRKEHRSLDSILFEDESELEYFDVLNLLPLSNVRLKFDEDDDDDDEEDNDEELKIARNNNYPSRNEEDRIIRRIKTDNEDVVLPCCTKRINDKYQEDLLSSNIDDNLNVEIKSKNVTDEEKCKRHSNNTPTITTTTNKYEIVSIDGYNSREEEEEDEDEEEEEEENKDKEEEEEEEEEEKVEQVVVKRKTSLINFLKIQDRRVVNDTGENSPESLQNLENLERSLEISTCIENVSKIEEIGTSCSSLIIDQDDSYSARFALIKSIGDKKVDWRSIEKEKEKQEEGQGEEEVEVILGEEIEEENSTTIWISDNEEELEEEDMSRRPQILKVIDNDVTKRSTNRRSMEIDINVEDVDKCELVKKESNDSKDFLSKLERTNDYVDGSTTIRKAVSREEKTEASVKNVKNVFENDISREKAITLKTKQIEASRFERIVKETSNIFGKACNVVKGSLGFEARSESSDLGLGSEIETDTRRRSVDEDDENDNNNNNNNDNKDFKRDRVKVIRINQNDNLDQKDENLKKSYNNLIRSKSCADSIESQNDDTQEFDHVRYKIVKSNVFSKNMYSSCGRGEVTYDGLMEYLREYSFQELLLDNNVVIIEPVRAEQQIERKSSSASDKKRKEIDNNKSPCTTIDRTKNNDIDKDSRIGGNDNVNGRCKITKQSSIRKHFFYHPIRVNRELIDEELPDPDTVRNVRRMFEDTLRKKNSTNTNLDTDKDCKNRKSVSMKDLTSIDSDTRYEEEVLDKNEEISRSRCSSRAKDLTKMFESIEKTTSTTASTTGNKDDSSENPRSESKTRILAQSFEARSGQTSPCDSNSSSKNKVNRYQHHQQNQNHHHHHHHHHHHNWDSGSVSSGVSSDYPDTDPGSGVQCTSSEDEDCHYDDDGLDESGPGHYVSQDVLKKIRECGTSVTYYGGKVVNASNGPLISPLIDNRFKIIDRSKNDYVKFRLVKSNSCDSRLELTGRLIERQIKVNNKNDITVTPDLRECVIIETPSIEITTIDTESRQCNKINQDKKEIVTKEEPKREPPVVIGLEPKKDELKESKLFKADFKLGNYQDNKSNYRARFNESALTRWQVNENHWRNGHDFGKMEFEEFEVLEDSLNGMDNQNQRSNDS